MRAKPLKEIIEHIETASENLETSNDDISTWNSDPHYKALFDALLELKNHYLENQPTEGIIKLPYQVLYLNNLWATSIAEEMSDCDEREKRLKLADVWYELSGVMNDIIELAHDNSEYAED